MFVNIIAKMVIIFHIFSCLWIKIGDGEDGWRNQILKEYYRSTYLHKNDEPWVH